MNLTEIQRRTMVLIGEAISARGEVSLSEIGRAFRISSNGAKKTVIALEAKGLLMTEWAKRNGISITKEGAAYLVPGRVVSPEEANNG